MNKYAYAYFDTNGTLKEFIIDPSVRKGNVNINKIYIVWNNPQPHDYLAQTFINTDLQDAEWSTPTIIRETGDESFVLPVIQDYDPKYFKYGKTYENDANTLVALVDISDSLIDNANIGLSILAMNDTNENDEYDPEDQLVMYLGILTYHVENTGLNFPIELNKSQFYFLMEKISEVVNDFYSKEEINTLLNNKADKIGPMPYYYVESTDNIINFINTNNVDGKPLFLFIGSNVLYGSFKNIENSRYDIKFLVFPDGYIYSTSFDLLNVTFSSLLNYRQYFEKEWRKVNTITSESTNNNYPSAKAVWDLVQDLKTKAFIKVDTTIYPTLEDFLESVGEEGYIYLYPLNDSDNNYYQYIYESNQWVNLGTTGLDLNNYYDKTEIDNLLDDKADITDVYDKTTVNSLLSYKEDVANKVTSLSSSNTDVQYPSAKAVYDLSEELREVAEGKCTTYVLDDNPNLQDLIEFGWRNCIYIDNNGEIQHFSSDSEIETWITGKTLVNSSFNSQNAIITISKIWGDDTDISYFVCSIREGTLFVTLEQLAHLVKYGDIVLITEIDVPDRWVSGISFETEDTNLSLSFSKLETSKVDLNNYYTKSEADANVPLHQANTILITDALTNINGRALSNYTATSVTSGGYTYYQITYQDTATITEEQVKTYMKSMTGSELIPVYDYNFPINTYFIMSNGSIWKPQYDSVNGLRLYKAGGDLLTNDKSLIPAVAGTYDLGSSTYTWKDIYINTIYLENVSFRGTATSDLIVKCGNYDRYMFSGGRFRPMITNYSDLGNSSYTWKDIYISGKIDFGNNTSISKDSSDRININFNNQATIKVGGAGGQTYITSSFTPDSSNININLGRDTVPWNNIYIKGVISDGTNSATVADIANGIINVINASDIVNNTLTQDQYDLITNGKPTLIKGSILYQNGAFIYGTATTSSLTYLYALIIESTNRCRLSGFIVNNSSKVISLIADNDQRINIKGLYQINGKTIPAYPANTGTFTLKCVDGSLTWVAD